MLMSDAPPDTDDEFGDGTRLSMFPPSRRLRRLDVGAYGMRL